MQPLNTNDCFDETVASMNTQPTEPVDERRSIPLGTCGATDRSSPLATVPPSRGSSVVSPSASPEQVNFGPAPSGGQMFADKRRWSSGGEYSLHSSQLECPSSPPLPWIYSFWVFFRPSAPLRCVKTCSKRIICTHRMATPNSYP